MILCQFDAWFKPELGIASGRLDMNVHSWLFARVEKESKTLISKDGWAHPFGAFS